MQIPLSTFTEIRQPGVVPLNIGFAEFRRSCVVPEGTGMSQLTFAEDRKPNIVPEHTNTPKQTAEIGKPGVASERTHIPQSSAFRDPQTRSSFRAHRATQTHACRNLQTKCSPGTGKHTEKKTHFVEIRKPGVILEPTRIPQSTLAINPQTKCRPKTNRVTASPPLQTSANQL